MRRRGCIVFELCCCQGVSRSCLTRRRGCCWCPAKTTSLSCSLAEKTALRDAKLDVLFDATMNIGIY